MHNTCRDEYMEGLIKFRDIPLEKLSRDILLKAAVDEPKDFLDFIVEICEKDINGLINFDLSIGLVLDLVANTYITMDFYLKLFKLNPIEVYRFIPRQFLTQEMCEEYFEKCKTYAVVHLCIPEEFRTREMWKVLISEPKYTCLFVKIPEELLDQEMCDIYFNKYPLKGFKNIPIQFRTKDMCVNLVRRMTFHYMEDISLLEEIPLEFWNQEMCDELFIWDHNCFKYIPEKFRTKEMYVEVLQNDIFNYINFVISKINDPEIISVAVFELRKLIKEKKTIDIDLTLFLELIKMYPDLNKVLSREKKEELINRELYLLIDNGGSLESIAKRFELSVSSINNKLEEMKDKDMRTYVKIKKILERNADLYMMSMLNDIDNFGKIILSLGSLNGNSLNIEQKVKFAYLYYKYIYNSLDEIYIFNKRYYKNVNVMSMQEIIDRTRAIDTFFRRFFKFHFIYNDTIFLEDIPEVKTIMFNNSWVRKYERDKFFAIKDGRPTMEHRYGKNGNLLTLDIEQYVVNELKKIGIPLNDCVVQCAFREYFNDNLDEYINKLLSYDDEVKIECKTKRR